MYSWTIERMVHMTRSEVIATLTDMAVENDCVFPHDAETLREAVRLLEAAAALEPRLLTLDEVLNDNECWFEWFGAITGTFVQCGSPGEVPGYIPVWGIHEHFLVDVYDYGVTWRCWSAHPTQAQRDSQPWNSHENNHERS